MFVLVIYFFCIFMVLSCGALWSCLLIIRPVSRWQNDRRHWANGAHEWEKINDGRKMLHAITDFSVPALLSVFVSSVNRSVDFIS